MLDLERGRLFDADGEERVLRAKSFEVLRVLAERAGAVVSKDELARAVWPDVIASDDTIAHCVSEIRKALGPAGARHIRTAPRRGYMFAPAPQPAAARSRPLRSWRRHAVRAAPALAVALAAVAFALAPAPDAPEREAQAGRAVEAAAALLRDPDWTRRADNDAARALLETAAAATPGDARIETLRALTFWREVRLPAWGGGRREERRALAHLGAAIADGDDPGAQRLLAEIRLLSPFDETRDPLGALAAARAAARLAPDDAETRATLAMALALTGRAQEARAEIASALARDPGLARRYGWVAGLGHLLAGAPEAAVAALTTAAPDDGRSWLLAASLARAGREPEAAALIAPELARRPGLTAAAVATRFDGFDDPEVKAVILDGLRRAGLPG